MGDAGWTDLDADGSVQVRVVRAGRARALLLPDSLCEGPRGRRVGRPRGGPDVTAHDVLREVGFEIAFVGRAPPEARLVAAQSERAGELVPYPRGGKLVAEAWTPAVAMARQAVAEALGVRAARFDACVLDEQRSGHDHASWDGADLPDDGDDDPDEDGGGPLVAVYSLGGTRDVEFAPTGVGAAARRGGAEAAGLLRLEVRDGDVLAARGAGLRRWTHRVLARPGSRAPRVSLTFFAARPRRA